MSVRWRIRSVDLASYRCWGWALSPRILIVLDSDDPRLAELVEESAAAYGVTLERVEL